MAGTCADLKITGYRIEYSREDMTFNVKSVSVPDMYRYELGNLTEHKSFTIKVSFYLFVSTSTLLYNTAKQTNEQTNKNNKSINTLFPVFLCQNNSVSVTC